MKKITRHILIILVSIALAACGGGGGGGTESSAPSLASAPVELSTLQNALPTAAARVNSFNYESSSGQNYLVKILGDSGVESYAYSLNDNGQVIGISVGQFGTPDSFLWEDNDFKVIAVDGQVRHINNSGAVIGWINEAGHTQAFVYAAGQMELINTQGTESEGLGLNDAGMAVGSVTMDDERAFIADGNVIRLVDNHPQGSALDINNRNQVLVMQVTGADEFRTLIWDNGALTDIGTLGGKMTMGRDINDAGQVVGWSQTATGAYHAFLWSNGVMTDLSGVSGEFGAAVAINENGSVLIKSSNFDQTKNLIYHNGTVEDLGTFGARYTVVNDINNRGEIVGWMETEQGDIRAFVASPVN